MVTITRRTMMAGGCSGALAMPVLGGIGSLHSRGARGSVLAYDATLEAGRRFAAAGRSAGAQVAGLEGDPIRFAQQVLPTTPALIAGLAGYADALLLEEAATEGGYIRVAAFQSHGARCTAADCRPGWAPLGRFVADAHDGWVEALAMYCARENRSGQPIVPDGRRHADTRHAFAFVLVRHV